MADYELVTLNTVTPQLEGAQSGNRSILPGGGLVSDVAASGSAKAFALDSSNTMGAGDLLLDLTNNGTQSFQVDRLGYTRVGPTSTTSLVSSVNSIAYRYNNTDRSLVYLADGAGFDIQLHSKNASGAILSTINSVDTFKVDTNATAGNTRMLVYDVDNATMERVSVGAADSGGSGYKVLRIQN